VLIVTTIAATAVLVRLWPVPAVPPLLASRHLQLYQAPVALPPATGTTTSALARRARSMPAPVISIPSIPAPAPLSTEIVADASQAPEEPAAIDVLAEQTPVGAAITDVEGGTGNAAEEPLVLVDVYDPADVPPVIRVEDAQPVASSSRGIVELPAVAVTRAVTIAGRGIMTGLKATSAILRAPF
jgi:hypothetical protein